MTVARLRMDRQEAGRKKEERAAFELAFWASKNESILEAGESSGAGQPRPCPRTRIPRKASACRRCCSADALVRAANVRFNDDSLSTRVDPLAL